MIFKMLNADSTHIRSRALMGSDSFKGLAELSLRLRSENKTGRTASMMHFTIVSWFSDKESLQ